MSIAVRPRRARLTYNASRRQISSSSEITALPRIRTHLAVALLGMSAVLGLAACSSPSSTVPRLRREDSDGGVAETRPRSLDSHQPSARPSLAGILDSMAHQLTSAEAAVPLPRQPHPLRDLGGVGYLRQLNRDLPLSRLTSCALLMLAVSRSWSSNSRPTITTQAGQVQRVADAITGCS